MLSMMLNRRSLIMFASAMANSRDLLVAQRAHGLKAVAFDAFTILDPRPIAARAEHMYPGKGARLTDLWRSRQFEYTWLRTLSNTYVDFRQITEEALVHSARSLGLDLSRTARLHLVRSFYHFNPWPDSLSALQQLRRAGFRLVLLSNFTEEMMAAAVETCGLRGLLEHNLSTDRVRAFKPAPGAYRMAMDALGLQRDEILFAAFAGWDAAGAKAFGYPTFWVNRMNAVPDELGTAADANGQDLHQLVAFATSAKTGTRLRKLRRIDTFVRHGAAIPE